jgi:hypothetical protein
MEAQEAQNWYTFITTLALEWWFIRSVGTTGLSYASRMMYRSHLHNTTKLSKETITDKSKGVIVTSHFIWTLIFTWLARRPEFLSISFLDRIDLIVIEMFMFLTGSLLCYQAWDRGLAPLSDKYLGTKFTDKKKK